MTRSGRVSPVSSRLKPLAFSAACRFSVYQRCAQVSKVRSGVPAMRQVQHLTSSVFRCCNAERDAIDLDRTVPDTDFPWLHVPECGGYGQAVPTSCGSSGKADTGGNPSLLQEFEAVLTDERSVREDAAYVALRTGGDEAPVKRFSRSLATGAAMREKGPHQRQTEPIPYGGQQEDVDVTLSELPVRPIKNQIKFALREQGHSKAAKQFFGQRKLHVLVADAGPTFLHDRAGERDS